MSLSACRDDYTKEGGEITTADIEILRQSMETTIIEEEIATEETIELTNACLKAQEAADTGKIIYF